jgi:translation initiation factor eIF-2B subunit beta
MDDNSDHEEVFPEDEGDDEVEGPSLTQSGMLTTHTASVGKKILLSRGFDTKLKSTIDSLRRRELAGSFKVALATAELMKVVVSAAKWNSAQSVMEQVREIGKMLIDAAPLELAIGNIVRRVLSIIREEYLSFQRTVDAAAQGEPLRELDPYSSPALYKMLAHEKHEDYTQGYNIKAAVITSISELIDEISNLYRNIADQALQHIHANEVIMTFGLSHTVEEFLKAAARKRKFEVIVAESAPSLMGRETVLALAKEGIETTLIPDSAIFAMMARVNKVIIGTHAVMANGGLIALTGTHALALAAKHHEVPMVVCMGLYKLCPLYPTHDQDSFNNIFAPNPILSFEEVPDCEHVRVENPAFDYVPPELISLFLTNFGGQSPSYIYRLLVEYYHPSDYLL